MFQASRQLFHRSHSATTPVGPASASKPGDSPRPDERHPAMRGLDVSPVHGRHCICARCEQHTGKDAA